jgi:UDP-2-acetamido-2,6-beta-L-arabino-hexul-4-ose reductase
MTHKIAVTGAGGFIGKHVLVALASRDDLEATAITRGVTDAELRSAVRSADTVVHLAAANRPTHESEFETTNVTFSRHLSDVIGELRPSARVIFTSSIHAATDTPYGRSKLNAENIWRDHAARYATGVDIFRFPNVFGKWCRPNYNSAVATFAHNIARDLPITVSDRLRSVPLIYIDDVIAEILGAIDNSPPPHIATVRTPATTRAGEHTLGEIVTLLESFRSGAVPADGSTVFEQQLYTTFVSYLSEPVFVGVDTRARTGESCE